MNVAQMGSFNGHPQGVKVMGWNTPLVLKEIYMEKTTTKADKFLLYNDGKLSKSGQNAAKQMND